MGFCWKRKKSPKIYCNITSFLIIKAKKLFLIPCEISENVLLPMHCVASALARSKGSDEREAASQLFGRLSLNLMRGNALMLASRAPDVDIPRAEVDGVQWSTSCLFHVILHVIKISSLFNRDTRAELFPNYRQSMLPEKHTKRKLWPSWNRSWWHDSVHFNY